VAEHCRLRRDHVDVHEHARPERPPLEGTEVCTERRLALGAPREIRPRAGLGEAFDPDWWVKGLIQRENIGGLGPKAILLRTEDAELDGRLDDQFTEKQVRDILADFNARVIDARRQLAGEGSIRNSVKTSASKAQVPLLPALERELRAHRSRQASIDLRLVHRGQLVFTTARGKPQGRRNALRALHAAGDTAGLNGEGREPVGLHDLRHSFVAVALDSGVTLAEAAVLARHANAGVTGVIYAGVSEKAKAQIASKLTDAGFGS